MGSRMRRQLFPAGPAGGGGGEEAATPEQQQQRRRWRHSHQLLSDNNNNNSRNHHHQPQPQQKQQQQRQHMFHPLSLLVPSSSFFLLLAINIIIIIFHFLGALPLPTDAQHFQQEHHQQQQHFLQQQQQQQQFIIPRIIRQQHHQQQPAHLQSRQRQQREQRQRINAAAVAVADNSAAGGGNGRINGRMLVAAAAMTAPKSIGEGGGVEGVGPLVAVVAQQQQQQQQQQRSLQHPHQQRRNVAAAGGGGPMAALTTTGAASSAAATHQQPHSAPAALAPARTTNTGSNDGQLIKKQHRREQQQGAGEQQQKQQRARVKGYTTDERAGGGGGGQVQVVELDCNAPPAPNQCQLSGAGPNYNPTLGGSIPGAPGIIARLNQQAFQYLSQLAGGILNYFIKRARLPNISQCIPQINGCINVYNLYVSRYRCPQRVTVYPAPPNQLVIDVQNLDIGVTGNLGGQIVILLPLALFGIVQVNAHQVSVRVSVTIACGPDGGPVLRMLSCSASVGYVDVYIQNGGLIGDIANSQFRGKISEMVRQQIPGQLCQRLPGILDQEVNSKLASQIPRRIPLSQLLQIAINAFGFGNLLSGGGAGGQCPASCNAKKAAALAAAQQANSTVLLLPPHLQVPLNGSDSGGTTALSAPTLLVINNNGTTNANGNNAGIPPRPSTGTQQTTTARAITTTLAATIAATAAAANLKEKHLEAVAASALSKGNEDERKLLAGRKTLNRARGAQTNSDGAAPLLLVNGASNQTLVQLLHSQQQLEPHQQQQRHGRTMMLIAPWAPHAQRPRRAAQLMAATALLASNNDQMIGTKNKSRRATPSESGRLSFVDPGENLCTNCPAAGQQESPLGFLAVILQSMDLSKLNNIYLDVSLLCDNTVATDHDFTIQLKGEFSVCGHGCTPFGAFPMHFPDCVGCKMVEILISDFTINSLLYHLHNVGFLRVRIGPETPKIGELLKTTCGTSESEDESELEDHGVENEDGTVVHAAKARRRRQEMGDFAGLGICLGDILPAVRERYPNERVYIVISTERAPSVQLSARNGGLATLDVVVNADFYIESTNQKVGTIRIAAVIDVMVRPRGNHITAHADISYLNLQDVGNQLGLPQDALDNLGNLGKELILKAGNDALERGTTLNIPNGIGGLPISIINPEFHILDHALLIQSDFTLNPNALGGSEPC